MSNVINDIMRFYRFVVGLDSCYKINNKVLTKSMIKAIRMRPAQKPFITKQIIYNHREELVDSNSEMSFLKLSENTSKQLNSPANYDHFYAVEQHLNRLQQKSALKLSAVTKELNFLETIATEEPAKRKNMVRFRQIIEQNKQNLQLTYRRVGAHVSQDNTFECNFQVDEYRNYVKNGSVNNKNLVIGQTKGVNRSKQFYSLENSRISLGKEEGLVLGKIKKVNSTIENHNCSKSIRNGSVELKRKNWSRGDRVKQSHQQSVSSKRCGSSVDSCSRRGRIYEQILSLYSIPKLLAMQIRNK